MANSTVISIRLNNDDRKVLEQAAREEGLTLSEYSKATLFDRAENLLDIVKIKRAVAHAKRHPETVHPWSQIKKELASK